MRCLPWWPKLSFSQMGQTWKEKGKEIVRSIYIAEIWVRTGTSSCSGKGRRMHCMFATSLSAALGSLCVLVGKERLNSVPAWYSSAPERSKYPRLHTSLIEIAFWSDITTTPFSLYFMNGRIRCWPCVVEQRKNRLVRHSVLALHFLGLQIRMQKKNALSALAKCKGNIFAYFWYVILSADSFFFSVK